MDLICNELSYYPLADSDNEAEKRFSQLIDTFKEANNTYGFKRILFYPDYGKQSITVDKNFFEWIISVSNSTLKNAILTFFRKPFADDLNEDELEALFRSDYQIIGQVPTQKSPIGLPIAHIKSTPTISFNSDTFWQNRKINLLKTNTSEPENLNFTVYNICLTTDLKTEEIIEWTDKVMTNRIDSEEMLVKYLSYSKYSLTFGEDFLEQLFEWKSTDLILFKRILLLMKDVQIHPFTAGLGKTENLKNRGKEASKRITSEHRLSYKLQENIVTFIACKGHYNFH